MRDPDRIEPMIEELMELWKASPDFRLGQLIMVIADTGTHHPELFYMEDDAFLEKLNGLKKKLTNL